MAQPQCSSAFKPVSQLSATSSESRQHHQHHKNQLNKFKSAHQLLQAVGSSSCSNESSSSGSPSGNENFSSFDNFSSSSSSSCSSISSSNNISISNQNNSSNHNSSFGSPFYIDKIFNFQNMFLFSNSSSANSSSSGANNPGGQTGNTLPPHLDHPSHHHMPSFPTSSPHHQHLNNAHSFMAPFFSQLQNQSFNPLLEDLNQHTNKLDLQQIIQQNLFQNYYSLFSMHQQNRSGSKQPTGSSPSSATGSAASKSSNFSIDRILSMPNKPKSSSTSSLSSNKSGSHPLQPTPPASSYLRFPSNPTSVVPNTPLALTAPIPPGILASRSFLSSKQASKMPPIKVDKKYQQVVDGTSPAAPVTKSKNAKKYKCDLCGRGFSRSNTLITHRVSKKKHLFLFQGRVDYSRIPGQCW